ncbi:MAG: hypothetical protein Q4G62_09305 [Pseudomonadota bacterium]|nr:hypothetical protein [Pseudomonadota bacterium]
MRKYLLLFVLLTCVAPALPAQEKPDEDDAYTAIFNGMRAQSGLLDRYSFLLEKKRASDDPEIINFIDQMLASELAEMAHYRQAESIYGPITRNQPSTLPSGTAVPALQAILDMTRDQRVVMINEAHTVARTRVLTLQLLEPMREAGFTHLGLETLSVGDDGRLFDDALPTRGYPTNHSGYYTREPIFAEIIREAIRLGYTLVAYEYQGTDRSQQARRAKPAKPQHWLPSSSRTPRRVYWFTPGMGTSLRIHPTSWQAPERWPTNSSA